MADRPPAKEAVSGLVERITYHNPENGFAVLRVRIRGRHDVDTVVGRVPSVATGEALQATGEWVLDREHGRQFRADFIRTGPPSSVEGIEKYLGSGMIRGIGPVFARKLVTTFGAEVLDIIEAAPARLREVPGIGPARAQSIARAWEQQKAVREIMVFLHGHGVGTSRAVRIFKTWGLDAIRIISENPYVLARDIRGIGFLTADAVAEKLGIERDALVRVRAGLSHVLAQATEQGHCGLPTAALAAAAEKLLAVMPRRIDEALQLELETGELVQDAVDDLPCVFLPSLYRAERSIAQSLLALAAGAPPWPEIDVDRAVPWVEGRTGLKLAPSQLAALRLALRSKVVVITGGPGVGKTTLLDALLRILVAKGLRLALGAPTGRAAKRLAETTGLEAKTIHRLLEVDPRRGGFRRDEGRPLDADVVVIDEVSMVDVPLMASLLAAVPRRGGLVLVGDVDQLPSVGPGRVLADIIASGVVPVVRLSEVFRQAAESRIIVNAHRINRGEMPDVTAAAKGSDFEFVEIAQADDGLSRLLDIVRNRIPKRLGLDPIRDIQVLCPMNRGSLGTRALNLELQRALNPAGEPRIERYGWTFAPGDKVMQTENDYDKEVFNGDMGIVRRVDLDSSEVTVDFDGRAVLYDIAELDRLSLAYAATIHKSQGSEYPAVVIPLTTQHYPMLQRNLLYTGVTRGRQLVVVMGEKRALAIAVRGAQARQRHTRLRQWLTA